MSDFRIGEVFDGDVLFESIGVVLFGLFAVVGLLPPSGEVNACGMPLVPARSSSIAAKGSTSAAAGAASIVTAIPTTGIQDPSCNNIDRLDRLIVISPSIIEPELLLS
jgi:hypothetical protein